MITVVLAEDEDLVRSGFRYILEANSDISVLGEAGDGAGAVDLVREHAPDVVVMDIRMPKVDGIEATRRITEGHTAKVLVLTTFDLDEHVYQAMRAGASGFMLKDASPEQLAHAVRTVAAGESLLAPTVTRRLVERFIRQPPPGAEGSGVVRALSEREREVLRLIATGLSNLEIARRLHLSEATVKTHVSRIFAKLELRDRAQAVVCAYETGLVHPGQS